MSMPRPQSPGLPIPATSQRDLDHGWFRPSRLATTARASGHRTRAAPPPVAAGHPHSVGTPGEVAEAAAFLLGRQSGFRTGADLLRDGGVIEALRTGELSLTPPAES
ncbi:hypothetical protein [Streptomyces sp. NPDC051636]|uniref:hypothetical protein n=1 Tax=Streptomyces sp. NPDC051636 TaxID=3365663 RepID=UPI0037A4095B